MDQACNNKSTIYCTERRKFKSRFVLEYRFSQMELEHEIDNYFFRIFNQTSLRNRRIFTE